MSQVAPPQPKRRPHNATEGYLSRVSHSSPMNKILHLKLIGREIMFNYSADENTRIVSLHARHTGLVMVWGVPPAYTTSDLIQR